MIIHITGPPGAGKTTFGEVIAKEKGMKHLELDDIYMDFVSLRNSKKNVKDFKLNFWNDFRGPSQRKVILRQKNIVT